MVNIGQLLKVRSISLGLLEDGTPAAVRMDIKAGDYTHNSVISRSRCRACQAYLSSLSQVSTAGLNKNANPVRRHGFRKQVSLG